MRKKYLSALLFGALLFASAGTFTSCKDYDDDINNLQSQIDESKASLTDKLTAVESSIASLQSAQSTMQTDIANAQKAVQDAQATADEAAKAAAEAKLAATEAQANAIAEAQKQLEATKAELTELIQKGDSATQAEIDAANAEIAKIQGSVQALQAWQGTTEETLKNLVDADDTLATSLAGVQKDLVDLANRVGKLEAGLKTQEDALAAYKVENAADVTAIEGQLATLNEAVQKLAGLEPDDLVNMKNDITALEGQVSELSSSITAVNENLNILYIAVYKGITHIALVDGTCVETGKSYSSSSLQLLSDIAVQTYTFGSNKYGDVDIRHMPTGELDGAVSFVKGTRMKQTAHALLRVSPANALVNKSEIHLVDSKGNDLVGMGLVEVTNVNYFDGTLGTSRADGTISSINGLVEVEFQVGPKADEDSYDFDGAFIDAITTKDNRGQEYDKQFAVQIWQNKDIPATSEGTVAETFQRRIVSSYSLILTPEKNKNDEELNFKLYKDPKEEPTYVDEITNRWSDNEDESKAPVEYEWKDGVKADLIYTGSNATAWRARQANDDRTTDDQEAYSVKSGETFYIDLVGKDKETPTNAKYFYIVLDRDFVNATGDQDSELAAWNSYESNIEGINKVYTVEGGKTYAEMSINIPYSDVIGFRLYAANADGSLIDPDGRAFYVQVGEPAATISVPTQDITATADIDLGMKSAFINVADLEEWKKLIAAAEASKKNQITLEFDAKMKEAIRGDKGDVDENTKIDTYDVFTVEYYKDNIEGSKFTNTLTSVADLKSVKYIKLSFNAPANKLVDNHTYTGKVTFKVEAGGSDAGATTTIGVMNLSAKKVMPTVPAGYSAKANQVVNGKYLCYVLPTNDTAYPRDSKKDGTMKLTNSFNVFTDFVKWEDGKPVYNTTVDNGYSFTFKDAAYKQDNTVEDLVVKSSNNYEMIVDNSFIENGNGYETTVNYDFGNISYVYDEVTNKFERKDWKKEIDSFTTEFHCIPSAQTWAWKGKSSFLEKDGKTGRLTYNKPSTSEYTLVSIIGTSSYDNTTYGGAFNDFWKNKNTIGQSWDLDVIKENLEVELISNNGQVNEYFEPSIGQTPSGSVCINFTVVAQDIAPQADVASTLRLTMKDVFGHPVVVELPMNVHIDKGE